MILGFFCLFFVIYYNRFQRLKNGSEAGLSQIKVVLKKRLDMITQLVKIVKGYASFERNVMESVTKMRSLVGQRIPSGEIDKINGDSMGILKNILAVVENYPDLKTSKNVTDLMIAIRDVEDEIARQRYTYNNIVQEYNTKLDSFPSNLVAKIFSYDKLDYLQFEEEIKIKPDTWWNS